MLVGAGSLIDQIVDPVSPVLAIVADVVWIGTVMALRNCTIVTIYYGPRGAKEGVHTGQVASVFD